MAKYFELYFLGDVLDDVRLRNKVLQTLVLDTDTSPCPQTVTRIWEKTPADSPGRRVVVDRVILRSNRSILTARMTEYPESFVQQVAIKSLQEVPTMEKEAFEARLSSYLESVEQED